MEKTQPYAKYISAAVSGSKEYFVLGAKKNPQKQDGTPHFKISGVGLQPSVTCETLGDVLSAVEENVQVSDGRRSDREIRKGTKMTSSHYNRVRNYIVNEIEQYSEDMTPEEWAEEAR